MFVSNFVAILNILRLNFEEFGVLLIESIDSKRSNKKNIERKTPKILLATGKV